MSKFIVLHGFRDGQKVLVQTSKIETVAKDSWTDGEIIVTEKNEEPIFRKTKESLDQTEIPLGKGE